MNLEPHDVFRIGLGVIIGHKNFGVGHSIDSCVVKGMRPGTPNIWHQDVRPAFAIFSDHDTACHDVFDSLFVWDGVLDILLLFSLFCLLQAGGYGR